MHEFVESLQFSEELEWSSWGVIGHEKLADHWFWQQEQLAQVTHFSFEVRKERLEIEEDKGLAPQPKAILLLWMQYAIFAVLFIRKGKINRHQVGLEQIEET